MAEPLEVALKVADFLAKVAGVAALYIGVTNYRNSRADRAQDRRRKVHDEFWFQKVIWPQTIEPFLQGIQDVENWCGRFSKVAPSVEECKEMLYKLQSSLSATDAKQRMLAIVGGDFYEAILKIRYKIENDVAALLANVSRSDGLASADSPNMTVEALQMHASSYISETVNAAVEAQSKL